MLISYPLLAPDDKFEEDFVAEGLERLSGVYPVGPGQLWHGGCHLVCPASKTHTVRAIADGVIVAYRFPTEKPKDPAQLAEHALNYGGGWTHDGFILLKHEKESGEGVPVVFYSLYMHLQSLSSELKLKGDPGTVVTDGKKTVARKDTLGLLGSIYGQAERMHFEIFTDPDSFKAFFKQPKSGDGTSSLWGEAHFVIPSGTSYCLDPPSPSKAVETPYETILDLRVSLRYYQGSRRLRAYRPTGELIDDFTDPDTSAEYKLYKRAQEWFPKHTSAGYELIRHGRKFGPDALPANAPNWQLVPMGYGLRGWVDLNGPEIRKLSDADFPDWLWRPVQEDGKLGNSADGKCDAPALLDILDANTDGMLAPLELNYALTDEALQQRMKSLVCLFPSEWDAPDDKLEGKFGWIKAYFQNPASRQKELAEKQKAWILTVKTSTEARLPGLEKELAEAKAGKTRLEGRQAEIRRQCEEAAKALGAASKTLQQKRETLKKLQSQAKVQADALQKARDAEAEAASRAHEAQEYWERKDLTLRIETHSIAEVAVGIAFIEKQIDTARTTLKRVSQSLLEADRAIAKATDEMKAPPKDAEKAWERFKKHVTALQWWQEVKGTSGLNEPTVWHFHPLAFIDHYRKCHWLSRDEFSKIYPDSKQIQGNDLPALREVYRPHLNLMFYKYGVITPVRMSHFLGQGAVESGFLQIMQEQGMTGDIEGSKLKGKKINQKTTASEKDLGHWFGAVEGEDDPWWRLEKYNSHGTRITGSYSWINGNCGGVDAQKFRGRGFKQLTARANYSQYWVYRGWLDTSTFDKNWTSDPQYKAKNLAGMKKRPAQIDDPHKISVEPYSCIDSGGWYMTFARPKVMAAIDKDIASISSNPTEIETEKKISLSVTKAINGGDKDHQRRLEYTRAAKKVLI